MHERGQLCQDPQTEFALPRESLGVGRINHILRVHGHTILQERRAAEIFDEVGQLSLERLFPGFTENSVTQATLSAGQSRIGNKRARDIAASAHLGGVMAAKPRIQAMIQVCVSAKAPPGDSPPPISAPLMVKINPRQSCMFRRRLRQQTKLGSEQLEDCREQTSQTRPSHPSTQLRLPRWGQR